MTQAVIGGTGLTELPGLEITRTHAVETPYGPTSAPIEEGLFAGNPVLFLHRHGGRSATVPPHLVNYRANIWALHYLGAGSIVAANAVGHIDPVMTPGTLVIPDQLVDYTWGREHTFGDGADGTLLHVDFTYPFAAELRAQLLKAAASAAVPCRDGGTVAVVQGPRLEAAAEIRRMAQDGCHLVGMTSMPEAGLAREKGLDYASVCLIVNAAAGVGPDAISLEDIRRVLEQETARFTALLSAFLLT
ncbi:MAG: S-methyl-5'-thioinosine phosphorylase [Pseudomonadota bacterium]